MNWKQHQGNIGQLRSEASCMEKDPEVQDLILESEYYQNEILNHISQIWKMSFIKYTFN